MIIYESYISKMMNNETQNTTNTQISPVPDPDEERIGFIDLSKDEPTEVPTVEEQTQSQLISEDTLDSDSFIVPKIENLIEFETINQPTVNQSGDVGNERKWLLDQFIQYIKEVTKGSINTLESLENLAKKIFYEFQTKKKDYTILYKNEK